MIRYLLVGFVIVFAVLVVELRSQSSPRPTTPTTPVRYVPAPSWLPSTVPCAAYGCPYTPGGYLQGQSN